MAKKPTASPPPHASVKDDKEIELKQFLLRLPAHVHKKLRIRAAIEEVPMNFLISHILAEFVEKEPNHDR